MHYLKSLGLMSKTFFRFHAQKAKELERNPEAGGGWARQSVCVPEAADAKLLIVHSSKLFVNVICQWLLMDCG